MNFKVTRFVLLSITMSYLLFINVDYSSAARKPRQVMFYSASARLAWFPGVTFIGDYVALHNGYWESGGLDVKLNPGGFEYDAIKLVASGGDTFGVSSGPQIIQARANGVPVVAIGSVIPRSPIGWISKKGSGIRTLRDFSGKKVGAQYGTHSEIALEALCEKLDIDMRSFTRIPIKFDPRPFIVGEIDVMPVNIIDLPIDLRYQGIEINIIDPGDYGVSLSFGGVYFTTEDTIIRNRALVRGFIDAAKQGWMWAYNNPNESIDILSEYAPYGNTKVFHEKLNATFAFIMKGKKDYLGVFPMDYKDWKSTQTIMLKHGNLSKPIDLDNSYTNAFLR